MSSPRPARVLVPGVVIGLTLGAACAVPSARVLAETPDAPRSEPLAREMRVVMGTTAEVAAGGLVDPVPALDGAFAALDLVEERLSLWKESELAALNREGRRVVSEETFDVIRHALEIAAASGGAFDPTVEPLVRARFGHRRVTLDPSTRTVRLAHGARLVLDALAKGDAADRGLVALRNAGATRGVLDLGGSTLVVFGVPHTVDLRDPLGEERPWASFRLHEAALGTSGGDQQPGHILDPRTGRPARGVLQATVVAATAREADALSTAVFVLGAEEGLALLEERGAGGLVLLLDEGRRVVRATPGFSAAYDLVVAAGVEFRE